MRIAPTLRALLALTTWAAVDIPIGLPDQSQAGGRACDMEARRRLGRRAVTVFSPPPRAALAAESFAAAREAGARVSIQGFHLFPLIRDADRAVTPDRQDHVVEAHPELAFAAANNGVPVAEPKRTAAGRERRLGLLRPLMPGIDELHARRPAGVGNDDLLDAAALCWQAARIAAGQATRLPAHPPVDARGLRMEIWA